MYFLAALGAGGLSVSFFINFGLVTNGVIDKFSIAYFILHIPFIYVQYKTVMYFFKLKNKFSL